MGGGCSHTFPKAGNVNAEHSTCIQPIMAAATSIFSRKADLCYLVFFAVHLVVMFSMIGLTFRATDADERQMWTSIHCIHHGYAQTI